MSPHRRAVILFGIALVVVIAIASVTTWDRDTLIASNRQAGTTGLSRPHQPLDRAPGEAIPTYR
jgi:hypothetical protein